MSEKVKLEGLRDRLHRGVKLLIDSKEISSVKEAYDLLESYRITCVVGPEIATSPTLQAALLTAVNAGRRACLGGVRVLGCPPDALLLVPSPYGPATTVQEALHAVNPDGEVFSPDIRPGEPMIVFGSADQAVTQLREAGAGLAIRVTFDGWCSGVTPVVDSFRLGEQQEFTLAGVLAGALAVSECFQHLRKTNVQAMRRTVGMSLWRPDLGADGGNAWVSETGPKTSRLPLPSALWLLGLGHLGQAYLWALMLLPYADPSSVHLVLQDYDEITESGLSTGLLSEFAMLGQKKTRALTQVVERRGFQTSLVERRFDERLRVGPDDPQILLCGVDNLNARRFLESPGFAEVIEAGLGHTAQEYLEAHLHMFPSTRTASEVWSVGQEDGSETDSLLELPAYAALRSDSQDTCGVVQVAGAAVGVPFMGAVAGALAVAEAIRATMMDGPRFEVVDMSLRDPMRRTAVKRRICAAGKTLPYSLSH